MVSVSMITYKHEAYIAQAIEGVLMQVTDFEFEVIIADDCSPDTTQEIVNNIISTHPKGHMIKYFRHLQNLGMQPNGIFATTKCTGKYIAVCEGDDFWTDPYKLQKQVDFLEANKNIVLTGHNANVINNKNEIISDSKLPIEYQKDANNNDLKKGFWVLTLTMVFRNVFKINNYPNEFLYSSNGDTCLISFLGQFGGYHYHNDIKYASYRIHEGGVWSMTNQLEKNLKNIQTYDILKDYYKNEPEIKSYFYNLIKTTKNNIYELKLPHYSISQKIKNYLILLFIELNIFSLKQTIYLSKVLTKSFLKKNT